MTDPLSKLEVLRLSSWALEIARTLTSKTGLSVADSDEIRFPAGLQVSRRTGWWHSFTANKGGRDALSLVAFLKPCSQPIAETWARSWLASHEGYGAPISEAEEDEEESGRTEGWQAKVSEWAAARVPIAAGPVSNYLQKRGLADLPDHPADAQMIPANIVAPGVVGLAVTLRINGTPVGFQLLQLDAVTGEKIGKPRLTCFTGQNQPEGALTFGALPPPAVLKETLKGPLLVAEGFEDWPVMVADIGNSRADAHLVGLARLPWRARAPCMKGRFHTAWFRPRQVFPELAGNVVGVAGVSELAKVAVFKGCEVIVVPDGDEPGSPAAKALSGAIDSLLLQGAVVRLARMPAGQDSNDVLAQRGGAHLRTQVLGAEQATLSLQGEVTRLASLPDLEAAQQRREVAKRHGVTTSDIAAAVRKEKAGPPGQGPQEVQSEPPAPWDGPINLDSALHTFLRLLQAHVVMPRPYVAVVALWLGLVHLSRQHPRVRMPRAVNLKVQSSDPGAGKTTLAQAVAHLCPEATDVLEGYTAATLRREFTDAEDAGRGKPTLILDEAHRNFSEDVIRFVCGCTKPGLRTAISESLGDGRWITRRVDTFGPLFIAGIGDSPLEVRSREIVLLTRPEPIEVVPAQETSDEATPEMAEARAHMTAWAESIQDRIADPPTPPWLRGHGARTARNWLQVLSIAQQAGGEWPALVEEACSLVFGREHEMTILQRLLLGTVAAFDAQPDIRAGNGAQPVYRAADDKGRITTPTLLRHLLDDPDEQWRVVDKGAPICSYWLRSMFRNILEPPGAQRWATGPEAKRTTHRGYVRSQFADALKRYLPPDRPEEEGVSTSPASDPSDTSATSSETLQQNQRVSPVSDEAQPDPYPAQAQANDFNWLGDAGPDVSDDSHLENIELPPFPPPDPYQDPILPEILAVLKEHPNWSAERIARHLHQPADRVRKLRLPQPRVEDPYRRNDAEPAP